MGGNHHHGPSGWHHHPHQHRGLGAHTGSMDHIYSPKHHNGTFKAPGLHTFMGAPYCEPSREAIRAVGARVAFLGVPYDEGQVCRPGASSGPQGIREASTQYFPYMFEYKIDLLTAFNMVDCGDIPNVAANPERSHQFIYDYVTELLHGGAMVVLCGGDHSVPIPACRALSDFHKDGRIGYAHYDCHLDAASDWGGIKITNASGMARAVELPNCTGANIAHVGSRNAATPKDFVDFADDHGILVEMMDDVIDRGVVPITHGVMERCWKGCDSVYLSIDTDCLDSSCAPGTTLPEPNGFTAREMILAAKAAGEHGVGILEISELCSVFDINLITSKLSCMIVCNFLGSHAKAQGLNF